MESKGVFTVFRLIANTLAVGGGLIVFLVIGLLFQRERAKELIVQVRRAVERNRSQPAVATSGPKDAASSRPV